MSESCTAEFVNSGLKKEALFGYLDLANYIDSHVPENDIMQMYCVYCLLNAFEDAYDIETSNK